MIKKQPKKPVTYNSEIAEEICTKIATSSKGLRKLCKENPHWPDYGTIYDWRLKFPDFRAKWFESKRHQVEVLVDDLLEIADDGSQDSIIKVDDNGIERECYNTEYVNRSRIRIEVRKWLAAKLAPTMYGEKLSHDPNSYTSQEDALKNLE